MEPLADAAVHLWYVHAPTELPSVVATRLLEMLAPEERARHARFVQEKDRRQYLLGKVLVRSVLSRYRPLLPTEWVFTSNRFGKPVAANDPAPLHFNLSHTEGLIVCAVARHFEVGIDVEYLNRPVSLDVARRFFAPAEVAFLEQVHPEQRQRTFMLFWTLKEAYVKAPGSGLSLPLEQFAFHLHDPQGPRISFEPAMKDDASRWRFILPALPCADYQVALAVQCAASQTLELLVQPLEIADFTADARRI